MLKVSTQCSYTSIKLNHIRRILFRSQDFSAVKKYCTESWTKILRGQVSAQDFIFAKEVRLGTYRYGTSEQGDERAN